MIHRKRQILAFWQSFAFSRQSFAFFVDVSSCAPPPRPLSFSTTGTPVGHLRTSQADTGLAGGGRSKRKERPSHQVRLTPTTGQAGNNTVGQRWSQDGCARWSAARTGSLASAWDSESEIRVTYPRRAPHPGSTPRWTWPVRNLPPGVVSKR